MMIHLKKMSHARTYVFRFSFWFETTCGEKENIRRWFTFLQFRVSSLRDVMKQLENFLMFLRFDCDTFIAAACGHADWNFVGMKMFNQSCSTRHELNVCEPLRCNHLEFADELIQFDVELEIVHARFARSFLCRAEKFHANFSRQPFAIFQAKFFENSFVDRFRV